MIKAVIFDMFETLVTHYNCPVYFGRQIAEDAGIRAEEFLPAWDGREDERTLGQATLEEVIEKILRDFDVYSDETFQKIIRKRKESKISCFQNMHPEIIPMLAGLKSAGCKIGLITNCFSEEQEVIRDSVLLPYFDVPLLSCEVGLKKPDPAIFKLSMEKLGVKPEECLYVGDGGTQELETALAVGMNPLQAVWYLKSGTLQPAKRKAEFEAAESPMEVLKWLS